MSENSVGGMQKPIYAPFEIWRKLNDLYKAFRSKFKNRVKNFNEFLVYVLERGIPVVEQETRA